MSIKNHKHSTSCQLQIPTINGCTLWQTNIEGLKIVSSKELSELENRSDLHIRIHSSCFFSEQAGGLDCDCVDQLKSALWYIANVTDGIVFYLDQEGRGHGLEEKINIYKVMQERGVDTYEACEHLHLEHDIRDYSAVIKILKSLNISSVNLITNNPKKENALIKNDIHVSQLTFLPSLTRLENEMYLQSKEKKHNHRLYLDQISQHKKKNTLYFYHPYEENGFLSNLSEYGFRLRGIEWLSVEHFYKCHKYAKIGLNKQQNLEGLAQFEQENQARQDWEYIKQTVMFTGLFYKFKQNAKVRNMLLDTKDSLLVEQSTKDYYWGVGKNLTGQNNLGKLLMKLRTILQNNQ